MKYGFSVLGLFLILCVSLFAQHAFSQESQQELTLPTATTDTTVFDYEAEVFDPTSLIDSNTGLPTGIEEQVTIQQIPSIPKPGEVVNVRLTSYSTDLNKATITWTLSGRVISSEIGATTFSFQAPESGRVSTLVATIRKQDGGTISKTIVVSPADVDLIYEANTYAHPFFKGKRQYTSESVITFIAVPNFVGAGGAKIADANLVYTWKINGTVQQAASGYGRSTFAVKGALIERDASVTVEVSAVNSTLKASQTIPFRSTFPEVVLYENNPILGVVYEKAIIGTFLLERPQVDFEAVPYFFSGQYKDDDSLTYKWSINGTHITSKYPSENYLLLRNDRNEEGTALINLGLSHVNNILQVTNDSLRLEFKKVENASTNEEFTF